jgi:hypothetical protein
MTSRHPQHLIHAGVASLLLLLLCGSARGATPAASFTAFERAALPATAGPVAKSLPGQIERFDRSFLGLRWGANPSEARRVIAPDGSAHQPWYVVPARRGICLLRMGAGTCQPFAQALRGNLYLQALQTSSSSPTTPLTPGTPVVSRVVGVAPYGTIGISAPTKSGAVINGLVKKGMFAISGADMTNFTLAREALVGPIFSG